MPEKPNAASGIERRQYIRLDTVFPVQFRLESADRSKFISGWLQGYTNNISKGGICLSVNNFDPQWVKLLRNREAKLSLEIELPVIKRPVNALAKVAWMSDVPGSPNKYQIGLSYEEINAKQNNKILRYARLKQFFVPVSLSLIILLGLGLALNSYVSAKLINGNKSLVEQLVKIVQESSVAKQKVKIFSKEREDLQTKIQALELQIKSVEEKGKPSVNSLKLEDLIKVRETQDLSEQVDKLTKEKNALLEQLVSVQHKENDITEDLLHLDKRKAILVKENFDKMYQWLKIHQSLRTGLVASFEGSKDIAKWAFIYDQSLASQAFTYFSDFARCRKNLDFFAKKAQRENGLFYNAYYVNDGLPAEFTIHCGPNIWLGVAFLQYTKKSNDTRYLSLAEEIASKIIALQALDPDGGIRGGPNTQWYSTEHNLDAYAFFNMLYKVTSKDIYLKARDKTLNWLVKNTYDKEDLPVKRGKGDSTIATDTYAWSIAAIGPDKLMEAGMNPDRILEFAEKSCLVTADYTRPNGQKVQIKGFDFAPEKHLARGGVISSEWTAQMVISFKIMSEYYYKKSMIAKSRAYGLKADEYLVGLTNMIISSPSPSGQGEGCLPYATEEFIDTGHGWMTPSGKYTGSVSGTAYTLFAYYNYNPLELRE
ncbi:MAG: PilZ domain-containing protein [Candidatus Omnitrophica bacterium]|nr:PilZ domain-containing protein [Candidatus Omnitrophota bacterium]